MTRVTYGVSNSPLFLAAVMKHHLLIQPEKYKVNCETLDNSFYVDDSVVALKTPNEAEQIYKESTQMMLGAAMKLREWCSNDEILRNMFEKDNGAEISNIGKVLGIQWHINSDELSIDHNAVLDSVKSPGTKRNVLKMVSKIYDPMGFLGPFTLRMKILLHSIWKLKLGWDELLPASYEQPIAAERLAVQSSESEDALERGPGNFLIQINKSVHSPPPREDQPKVVTKAILDDSVSNADIMNKLLEIQATLTMVTLRPKTLEYGGEKNEIMVGEDLIKDYLPLTNLARLLDFDDLIKSNEKAFKQLVQKYLQFGGKNEADFLRRILSLTMSNSLATFCSWTGQKNNFRIKDMTIIKLMRGAVQKVFPAFSDCLFDKIAMEWLRHSKQRLLRETKN
ncbi:hypothetical protein JTB14_021651 [Gonioctena quinquepunctata]|nr:hypothetical protein JTB14_021651 [Gonioctena quinquepunctata]